MAKPSCKAKQKADITVSTPKAFLQGKLPAVMASGQGLLVWVHYENAHVVSAQNDFSLAVMQSMLSLRPSRPETFS